MTAPIGFAPSPQAFPQAPAQPQAFPQVPAQPMPMAPEASPAPSVPREAISALYKDTLATFVEYKMKEAAYTQLTGQSPAGALGQVGNNPFETPIQVGNEPQAIGPAPAQQQPEQPQAQQPSFMPGQTPPPQVPGMAPQV